MHSQHVTGQFLAERPLAAVEDDRLGHQLVIVLALAISNPAFAQSDSQGAVGLEEIVVTARKHEESIMQAPVIVQAITPREMQDLHVDEVDAIGQASPGLQMNTAYTLAGSTVYLRGIGTSGSSNYIDESVALNLDEFTSSSGLLFRQGLLDVSQIEVMKGPQSLFFGKSTTGGLIAIHSADPTSSWDSKVNVGYEVNAREKDVDGYISGPITDDLGIRFAAKHNWREGWMTNPDPGNSNHRLPGGQSNAARLTLKYDGSDRRLHVKFKGGFTNDTSDNWFGDLSQNICPPGGTATPFYRQYDDCTANRLVGGTPDVLPYNPNLTFNAFDNASFAVATPLPIFRDGVPYGYTNTALGVLSISYDITPRLTLSSVSASERAHGQEAGASPSPGVTLVDVGAFDRSQEFSQEVRLSSNWQDRWFNFMVGALYNPTTRTDKLDLVIVGAGSLPQLGTYNLYTDSNTRLKSETDGVFGQILLSPIRYWDLSAGVRYTSVEKHFTSMAVFHNYPALFSPGPPGEDIQDVPENLRSVRETALTPEVTLRYSPQEDVMAFVSYKEGYKGPGFNVNLSAPSFNATNVNPFAGEQTEGFEGGIKARLLGHQVALTAVGYWYSYRDLQVAVTDVAAHRAITRNGADARVRGIELGVDYSPQEIRGLSLNSYVNYNESYYTAFDSAACYSQQTPAQGCVTTPTLVYQDLTGRTLSLAPKWVGSLRGSYKWNLNSRYTAALNAALSYSSSYLAQNALQPLSYQGSYTLVNFGLNVAATDGAWEVALLCRDCTNRYYLTEGVDAGAGTGDATTASSLAYIGRPQEIFFQLTVHPRWH